MHESSIHRRRLGGAIAVALLAAVAACAPVAPDPAAQVTPASSSLQVFRPRGSVQCGDRGSAPEVMRAELERAGVPVRRASCGSDGRMYPAVCGGATGEINVFEIDAADAARARALGFLPLAELRDEPQLVPCR